MFTVRNFARVVVYSVCITLQIFSILLILHYKFLWNSVKIPSFLLSPSQRREAPLGEGY